MKFTFSIFFFNKSKLGVCYFLWKHFPRQCFLSLNYERLYRLTYAYTGLITNAVSLKLSPKIVYYSTPINWTELCLWHLGKPYELCQATLTTLSSRIYKHLAFVKPGLWNKVKSKFTSNFTSRLGIDKSRQQTKTEEIACYPKRSETGGVDCIKGFCYPFINDKIN